jgi:hypothetical protein
MLERATVSSPATRSGTGRKSQAALVKM